MKTRVIKTPRHHLTLGLGLVLGLMLLPTAITGCDSSPSPAVSHIRVLLTDAPLGEILEAHVIIERVELIGSGERVVLLADEAQPFDLLTLQDGVTAPLAELDIPDGTYHQLRVLVHEEASVVLDDGTVEVLKVPSGTQSGIKVPLPALEVNEDVVELTIDFDVSASFVKRGKSGKGYIFKPVLKPLALVVNGEAVALGEIADEGEDS